MRNSRSRTTELAGHLIGSTRRRWILITLLLPMSAWRELPAAEPSPVALLRGLEAARTRYDSLKATLEIRYLSPPPVKTVECLVEMAGTRLRFEVFEGEVPGQVIIRDGDEFRSYRRKAHADVDVYSIHEAAVVRGDVAFDPRVLGLGDENMSCNLTVRDCLWYENNESLRVVGQESLREVDVWRVRAVRRNSEGEYWSEYWVEEPSFRLHRRIVETPLQRIVVDSEFEPDSLQSPFPSRVTATRTLLRDKRDYKRVFLVKEFDAGAHIPAERFALNSLDLPVNTMINDYRISRIEGYWDGEGISTKPVYGAALPAPSAHEGPVGAGRRWVPILSGSLLLILIVVYVAWRHR